MIRLHLLFFSRCNLARGRSAWRDVLNDRRRAGEGQSNFAQKEQISESHCWSDCEEVRRTRGGKVISSGNRFSLRGRDDKSHRRYIIRKPESFHLYSLKHRDLHTHSCLIPLNTRLLHSQLTLMSDWRDSNPDQILINLLSQSDLMTRLIWSMRHVEKWETALIWYPTSASASGWY